MSIPTLLPALASHPWAYPALEIVHLLGVGLLFGNLTLFELRVWGLGVALPVAALGRLTIGLALAGFALAAVSGLLMFASQSAELAVNRVFVLKMVLLFVAGTNAALFHVRHGLDRLDGIAKLQTALSLGLWIVVVGCGRWIAYA